MARTFPILPVPAHQRQIHCTGSTADTSTRACFAWVRDASELERARREISDLFALRMAPDRRDTPPQLLGIWVGDGDPSGHQGLGGPDGEYAAVGLAGVWNVRFIAGERACRSTYVESVLAQTQQSGESGRFVPVYIPGQAGIDGEQSGLCSRFGAAVTDMLLQDPRTGAVCRREPGGPLGSTTMSTLP